MYQMNYTMPCLITAFTRYHTNNKTTGKKLNNKISTKKTFFAAKDQRLNLKTLSNDVEIQSEETLST